MWLMRSPTLWQFCFLFLFFSHVSSYSELQGVRPREDMTALVRTNLLHSGFFFFSWNLSYAMSYGTSVAIQQPSRKAPERKTDMSAHLSLSLSPLCPSKLLGDFYKYFLSLRGHSQQEGEKGGILALVLEMNPVCLGFHLWPDKRTSCLLWDGFKGKIRPSGY